MHVAHTPPERGFRVPGWLLVIVFVPLQIWCFWHLLQAWGFWWTLLFGIVLGMAANRAARAPWLTAWLMPNRARRHEMRRHVFQGVLFLAAALAWLLPRSVGVLGEPLASWAAAWPQPWLPLVIALSLVKSALH